MAGRGRFAVLSLVLSLVGPVSAADLAGRMFRDKNGNGLPDPGEEGLAGSVEVFGSRDAGGNADFTVPVAADGTFSAAAPDVADGCFALRVNPPAGFRVSLPRRDCPGSALAWPVGTRRYGAPRHLIDALRANSMLHIALGDSIAEPASGCVFLPPFNQTDYIGWLAGRLTCIAPGAVTVNAAIGGKRSYDLLLPASTCGPPNIPRGGPDRCDNLYDTIAQSPDLITISIGGNDFLEIEPTRQTEPFNQADLDASITKLIETRRNMQEILSAFASELPTTDVVLNTVYDNRAKSCASTAWHDVWVPVWDQVIRDVVWGQGERFQVAEIHPEYAHQDLNGANCCGEQNRICGNDVLVGINPPIHPDANGAKKHLEKVWDAVGGISFGPKDGIAATSNPDLLVPAEELVAVRFPSVANGTVPGNAALVRDDVGAAVPAGGDTVTVSGFDATAGDIVPTHVVVAVRYRTDQPPPPGNEADAVVFEAAVDGLFRAPTMSVTGWNTVVPIVGSGATAPQPNALPDVPQWREVRALLTKDLLDDGRASGSYDFPVIGWSDIATLAVRLRGAQRGSAKDSFAVEWDAAWIEVYGYHATPGYGVYRSTSPVGLVAPGNRIGSPAASPYDDVPPAAAVQFYAVDDGAGAPPLIRLVKRAPGLRIDWP